jgi:hypothetical protein
MQFSRSGAVVRVVRITGPSHNLLGLELAGQTGDVEVEEMEVPGTRHLHASDVRQNVQMGVADANDELNTQYAIRRIQFVPSDTGPAGVYRELAKAIVHHVASSERDLAAPLRSRRQAAQ